MPHLGVPCVSGGINPSALGGSMISINIPDTNPPPLHVPTHDNNHLHSPHHLQGTIV